MKKKKLLLLSLSSVFVISTLGCSKKTTQSTEKLSEFSHPKLIVANKDNIHNEDYLSHYDNNKVIFLDNSIESDNDIMHSLMKELGGISIASQYILLGKTKNGPKYFIYEEKPHPDLIKKHIDLISKENITNNINEDKVKTEIDETFTISSANISLVKRNVQCPMLMYYDEEDLKDYCAGNSFLELNYKIDMSGSKATMKEDPKTGMLIKTENAKYIIFSVSPEEEGGTGWHLAEDINQGFNRSEFLRSKRDFVGPYANKYHFWIKENNNVNDVKLVKTHPQNVNPGTNITQSHGMTIGLSGNVLGGIMNANPNASVNLGASVQVSNVRNMSFSTFEYTIENISHNNMANWSWDAKVNDKICDYLTRKDFNTCHFTEAVWKQSWSANKNKFSAISHKSFTPSFQAVYKTHKNNQGQSSFEIGTNVETGVILGRKVNLGLFKYINLKTHNYKIPNVVEKISVDWSSPFFASEINVRLQNVNELYASKCLLVDKSKKVIHSDCNNTRAQIWGYDNEEKQFKTRVFNEHCLNLDTNGYLSVSTCNINNNQKWVLNNQGYIQLSHDNNKVLGFDAYNNVKLVDINSQQKIKIEAYKAFL